MKVVARYYLLLIISLAFTVVCHAQKDSAWQRYAGEGEEFSALLPEEPAVNEITRPISFLSFFEKAKYGRMYGAYSDGTAFVILSLDNPEGDALEVFINEFQQYPVFHAGSSFEREVTLNGFKGKQYRLASNSVNGIVQFYLTNKRAYIFEVVGEDLAKPSVNKFLTSLTLGKTKGKSWLVAPTSVPSSTNATSQSAADSKTYNPREVTRKAVIVTRPEPQYTEAARENQIAGTVVLRAVLSSSGQVVNIRAVSGLPHGLTERAITAARQIKFLPAIKDGNFVSQYIQIEYNFNLY